MTMIPARILPCLALLAALGACAHQAQRAPAATPAADVAPLFADRDSEAAEPLAADYASDGLDGTLWYQDTVEHDQTYRGIYRAAQVALDRALADPRWDALDAEERKLPARGLPPAIIVDVDETVLDNSAYQARLIRKGGEFDEFSWDQYVNEKIARALPGAVEFANYATKRGVTVFYLTNRAEHLGAATLANLQQAGFPGSDREPVFFGLGTVVDNCETKGSEKGCRRELIGRKHRVLLLLGDQLTDFVDVLVNTPAARAQQAQLHADWFGERWFMLPNPLYGSWLNAVIGNAREAPWEQRHRVKRDALRVN